MKKEEGKVKRGGGGEKRCSRKVGNFFKVSKLGK